MDNESNWHRPAGGQPGPGRDPEGNSAYAANQRGQPAVDIIDSERRLPGGYGGTGETAGSGISVKDSITQICRLHNEVTQKS